MPHARPRGTRHRTTRRDHRISHLKRRPGYCRRSWCGSEWQEYLRHAEYNPQPLQKRLRLVACCVLTACYQTDTLQRVATPSMHLACHSRLKTAVKAPLAKRRRLVACTSDTSRLRTPFLGTMRRNRTIPIPGWLPGSSSHYSLIKVGQSSKLLHGLKSDHGRDQGPRDFPSTTHSSRKHAGT
jgi:hypothetical protein